jgi:hypothetical protein
LNPLELDKKAYRFFPSSNIFIMKNRNKRPLSTKKELGFTSMDKLSMMITKRESLNNFTPIAFKRNYNTTQISLMSKGFFSSFLPTSTNLKRPLRL